MSGFSIIAILVVLAGLLFIILPPKALASALKMFPVLVLGVLAVGLLFAKQFVAAGMVAMGAISLWRRWSGVGRLSSPSTGSHGASHSNVRSAALEMELDHETGAMNGIVLAGRHEGSELDAMERDDLFDLYGEIVDDAESLALLEAYLDRRYPAWREDTETDAGAGEAGAAGAGPMGQEEAYEVLGLAAGATAAEIRAAHRRLMKSAHPDSGGSTFLAAKINEAKDVLLSRHS
ncbi:MAG: DnaJ domain-containing protein [Pseudomonadota bacterium]